MVTTGHLLLDQETRNITHLKGTSSGQKPLFWKKRWILVLKYMCCFTFLFWILFCNDVFGKQTVCIYFAWKSVDKKTQSLYCTGTIVTFIEHLLCAKALFWASLRISITLWSKCHSYFLVIEGSYGIWNQVSSTVSNCPRYQKLEDDENILPTCCCCGNKEFVKKTIMP